jgi:hypothetical protein
MAYFQDYFKLHLKSLAQSLTCECLACVKAYSHIKICVVWEMLKFQWSRTQRVGGIVSNKWLAFGGRMRMSFMPS